MAIPVGRRVELPRYVADAPANSKIVVIAIIIQIPNSDLGSCVTLEK
jgi:hypothetical protein